MKSTDSFLELLQRAYHPQEWMKNRYPKSAKRRRIRNKWRNRFGEDLNVADLLNEDCPMLELAPK